MARRTNSSRGDACCDRRIDEELAEDKDKEVSLILCAGREHDLGSTPTQGGGWRRATLDGTLIANGITVWLAAQWGLSPSNRWRFRPSLGGTFAFTCAIAVHVAAGYGEVLYFAPSFAWWVMWTWHWLM